MEDRILLAQYENMIISINNASINETMGLDAKDKLDTIKLNFENFKKEINKIREKGKKDKK